MGITAKSDIMMISAPGSKFYSKHWNDEFVEKIVRRLYEMVDSGKLPLTTALLPAEGLQLNAVSFDEVYIESVYYVLVEMEADALFEKYGENVPDNLVEEVTSYDAEPYHSRGNEPETKKDYAMAWYRSAGELIVAEDPGLESEAMVFFEQFDLCMFHDTDEILLNDPQTSLFAVPDSFLTIHTHKGHFNMEIMECEDGLCVYPTDDCRNFKISDTRQVIRT